MSNNIMLVGLGPHAKRIYINFIKKHKFNLKIVVDLDSNSSNVLKYLKDEGLSFVKTYFIKRSEADLKELSPIVKKELKEIIKNEKITHAIISTEPKAHFAYSKFFIKNNINILMDKPITAPSDVLNNISSSKLVKKEYDVLKSIYLKHKDKMNFSILCQRRFHPGYLYIKKLLEEIIIKYKVPITYIDIYHSDGMWNMPNEFFERENHPYKYGYGKLFHSGYHFIDLLTWILESNKLLDKKIDNATIYSTCFRPYDFFGTINNEFYLNHLKTNKFKDILDNPSLIKDFGELDFHSMIDFKTNDQITTHATINLMQTGFSKRGWTDLPKDTYKENGRLRHERINIHVGPLFNIQIHSYQSTEVREKTNISKTILGGIDHFDIYIFRNTNIIGGKSFEKVSLSDLLDEADSLLGNNEKAREACFLDFFNNKNSSSDLLNHEESIYLLSKLCESIANKKNILHIKWGSYEN